MGYGDLCPKAGKAYRGGAAEPASEAILKLEQALRHTLQHTRPLSDGAWEVASFLQYETVFLDPHYHFLIE